MQRGNDKRKPHMNPHHKETNVFIGLFHTKCTELFQDVAGTQMCSLSLSFSHKHTVYFTAG